MKFQTEHISAHQNTPRLSATEKVTPSIFYDIKKKKKFTYQGDLRNEVAQL